MDTEKLAKLKELMDNGAITSEEFEREKAILLKENRKSPKSDKFKIGIGIAVIIIICIAIIGSFSPDENSDNQSPAKVSIVENIPDEFKGECPVEISAIMFDNIIGVPELSCSITNKTDREVSAIKLYFSPKDVYGENISSVLITNHIYTDDSILANSTVTKSWQFLDQEIKSGDVYIYSVYFSDGTEWGNKDATVSDIKKYGYKIDAKY